MRRIVTLLLGLTLIAGLAQETSEERIIRIHSEGASVSGNLRYGPHVYEHPEPDGIVATVSNLTIYSSRARLQVPEEEQGDTLLAEAEGRREAYFTGGVRVQRGRLTASGPELNYSESTGLGTLTGGARVDIAPEEEDDDPVEVDADEVEFDVDTDRSISRGDVSLVSGNQRAQADRLLYEEERDLGCLYGEDGNQITLVRTDEDEGELTITADMTCVLTEDERLYAVGNVTVVDDSITSSGEEVFFDDTQSLAEIIGSPARSVDTANGIELESDRIRQDVQYDYFEAIDASVPSDFERADFLPTETGDSSAPASTAGDGTESAGGGE